ncbi:MAG TPA: APC family permease [Polyangia bacterium]|nr:APC family permease [Polyangia bacterium]
MSQNNQTSPVAQPAEPDPRADLRTTSTGLVDLPEPDGHDSSLAVRIKRTLFGNPRDVHDASLFHHISLIPFLAWVGLGADGLSSSAYGPEEAFRNLGAHTYLAVALAAVMALTVFIISAAYRGIIEAFPHGGGGYVVATKLLGKAAGVTSGSALLVDYILTITVSIAAAGDAIFSFLPPGWVGLKMPLEIFFIGALTTLNLRGAKESAMALAPVFLIFVFSHLALIAGGILGRIPELPSTAHAVGTGFHGGLTTLGMGGMLLLFVHAYSLGGGTYTGIEAVSNGLPIMREPRVQTAKRTMLYMATSLAFTASGLLVCYLLWHVAPVDGKTMNAVLAERLTAHLPGGRAMVVVTMISEGVLLVVAAQAGFIDGPRVLANMAVDSWVPRRFAALSDRLTTHNGIMLMGATSLAALLYTKGDVGQLVVMYSINVFLTFSLSMFGMLRHTWHTRRESRGWLRKLALFTVGFTLCATILVITIMEKFKEGGWITLLCTSAVIALCFVIRGHYRRVRFKLAHLYQDVRHLGGSGDLPAIPIAAPGAPTAAVLVPSFGGIGIHTILNVFRAFPNHFKNLVFISVGLIDSGGFKGADAVEHLEADTEAMLKRYASVATELGVPSSYVFSVGTDAVAEAEKLCLSIMRQYPVVTFFGGKVVFERERWYQRLLHNETALAIQKRLYWAGATMVVLPARVTGAG